MTDEMVRYYAERAAEYDQVYDHPYFTEDVPAITQAVLETFRGKRVYEVACGTGYWTHQIAEVATAIYATDLNDETLAIARSRNYPPNVAQIIRADAYAQNTSSLLYNAGLAGFWLSHVDLGRMKEFIDAFHSHLEAGAVVLIFDEIQTEDRPLFASRVDDNSNRYEKRELNNGTTFEIIKNFFTPDLLKRHFADYATDIEYRENPRTWMLRYHVKK